MNTLNREKEAIKSRLQSREHREAFVSACVDQTIPFQVRAIRLAKKWTQKDLANKIGMKQERISTCENPNYGNFSLRTLKQLAAAFDVALIVRFAPFSELVEWEVNISPQSLELPSFEQEEDFFREISIDESDTNLLKKYYSQDATRQQDISLQQEPGLQSTRLSKGVLEMIPYKQKQQRVLKEISPLFQKEMLEDINESAVS
jgi:transcriptional regulator with XRE-family HTH domain